MLVISKNKVDVMYLGVNKYINHKLDYIFHLTRGLLILIMLHLYNRKYFYIDIEALFYIAQDKRHNSIKRML